MTGKPAPIEKQLRIAGILLITGLVVELITLRWSHPTAFLFFLVIGGLLIAAGVLLYLYSLVSSSEPARVPGSEPVEEVEESSN